MRKTNRETGPIDSAKPSQGTRRLPPLNAVRAFEAAARRGGFQAAGVELHVSANAVGRLVKLLEEWLGVALFRRLARGVVLTEAGRTYLGRVGQSLDLLADATAELQRRENSAVLTISAMPSFVARWLVPRLGRLTQRHRDLDIRLLAAVPLTDFAREEVDVAVRLGGGRYEGLHSELLLRERFYPVCSPALLKRGPRLKRPADLVQHTLLHDEWEQRIPDQIDWPQFLKAVDVAAGAGVNARRGPRFSFSHMTLEAAVAGQGVALASSALVADDLAAGRLVRPFPGLALDGPYGFHIVCPEATATRDKVVAFRCWALAEAGTKPQELRS